MRYLVDTDVLGKKDGPNGRNIRRWFATIDDNTLAISALTIFEISKGVQKKRDVGDDALADTLQAGLDVVAAAYADRILPVDAKLAESWGRVSGSDAKQWIDRGLLATAGVYGLILVTCNAKDMKGRGIEIIAPDRDSPGHWAADGAPLEAT